MLPAAGPMAGVKEQRGPVTAAKELDNISAENNSPRLQGLVNLPTFASKGYHSPS